ncbi:hypothetical protein ACTHOQ_17930 [Solibacillus silvestris]|uniref:hypothetical protein n=1 Tax=Solibacillus silvestris TaxID=76853 RepID=UPI003F7F1FA5
MNNFQNPFVDSGSYQEKVYDYYRNPTTPQSIHFSLSNKGGFEQKEIRQNQKNSQYDNTIKHPIYINHQLEKITESKPVMFSPPKVDSIQKPVNEEPIDELAFSNAQSKNPKNEKMDKKEVVSALIKEFSHMLDDTSSKNEGFATLQEDKVENDSILNSNESTSINVHAKNENFEMLFDEFRSMLDERDNHSVSEGKDIELLNENNDTIEDKFLTMLSESDELQEEKRYIYMNEEDAESLEENNDTTENKFFTMLSESDELQEGKQCIYMNEEDTETLNKNNNTIENKFFTMLSENDELLEKKQQSSFTNLKEAKSDKIKDLPKVEKIHFVQSDSNELLVQEKNSPVDDEFPSTHEKNNNEKEYNIDGKHDSSQQKKYLHSQEREDTDTPNDEIHLCEKKPSFKKDKKRKYCINRNEPFNRACLKEVDHGRFVQENTHFIVSVEKKKKTTVKMEVLLCRLETDIDIVETIDLLMPLDNIVKVEWTIQSLDCKVVLASKSVFLKGEFVAEIEFSNKALENKIQSLKVSIPWSKTANINWLTVPDSPHGSQSEFMFQSQHEYDPSFHYEYYQKFAEPIRSLLNQINFVWHQELNSKGKYLQVNGVAQLYIHFMQEQYVELDCYSK